jgi:tetratricopeptide (TPR) repeat protein
MYAPAYAGLAFIRAFTDDQVTARAYADKALALDPALAEAHMVHGLIQQFFDWDWAGTESDYREAIELNPGYAEAHHELSMLLMRQKRFDEALREAQLSLYLAPTSTRFLNGVGEVNAYSGRVNDALAIADRILGADSTFSGGFYIRGIAYEQTGRLADAEKAWRDCLRVAPKGCDYANAKLGYVYAVTGRRAQALRVLDTLKAQLLLYMGIEPTFLPLHNEPRFQALLKKIGLPS